METALSTSSAGDPYFGAVEPILGLYLLLLALALISIFFPHRR